VEDEIPTTLAEAFAWLAKIQREEQAEGRERPSKEYYRRARVLDEFIESDLFELDREIAESRLDRELGSRWGESA
jgi:hypothetical protein